MPVRSGAQSNANNTYGDQATQAFTGAQGDISQFGQNVSNLQQGKNVGANPYLNPQYLSAVNQLRSGSLNQQNNAADAQIRSNQVRTGGENGTATNGAISNLALQKMRLGNQLGAEQTAGDWTKNIGYQLNLAQMPLAAAGAQTGLYSTAQRGQSSALNDLTQEDLAQMQLAAAGISALGGAAGGAMCPAEGSLYLMADGTRTSGREPEGRRAHCRNRRRSAGDRGNPKRTRPDCSGGHRERLCCSELADACLRSTARRFHRSGESSRENNSHRSRRKRDRQCGSGRRRPSLQRDHQRLAHLPCRRRLGFRSRRRGASRQDEPLGKGRRPTRARRGGGRLEWAASSFHRCQRSWSRLSSDSRARFLVLRWGRDCRSTAVRR